MPYPGQKRGWGAWGAVGNAAGAPGLLHLTRVPVQGHRVIPGIVFNQEIAIAGASECPDLPADFPQRPMPPRYSA